MVGEPKKVNDPIAILWERPIFVSVIGPMSFPPVHRLKFIFPLILWSGPFVLKRAFSAKKETLNKDS